MSEEMHEERLQYITDDEGNRTHVILSLDVFEGMIATIHELETHYLAHHPEELEDILDEILEDEGMTEEDLERLLEEQ